METDSPRARRALWAKRALAVAALTMGAGLFVATGLGVVDGVDALGGEEPGPAVADLAASPEEHAGELVTIRGAVSKVVVGRGAAFGLKPHDGGRAVLVLPRRDVVVPRLHRTEDTEVVGRVVRLDRTQLRRRRLLAEYRGDEGKRALEQRLGRWAVVATAIDDDPIPAR